MPMYLQKALAELGRVIALAIIPVLISGLESGNIDPMIILVTGLIAGLRFIDKLLHEIGKERGDESLTRGLTRF